jgi:hypothetical protein
MSVSKVVIPLPEKDRPSYKSRGGPLTPPEAQFYLALAHAVYPELIVFPKIRIADIITPEARYNSSEWFSAFGRIKAKHVDFVLCKGTTLETVAVVELDGLSHESVNQMKRDEFVNEAISSCGIHVLRVPQQTSYSIPDARRMIFSALKLQA